MRGIGVIVSAIRQPNVHEGELVRLVTFRTAQGTSAARLVGDRSELLGLDVLRPGDVVETTIEGIGAMRNVCQASERSR